MSLQIFITLAVFVAAVVAQSSLTVNTPTSLQACLPSQITWSGGTPPYFVAIIPAAQPGGKILKDFGQQDSTFLTWDVDQPAGTPITVQIRDNTGTLNYSDKVTVQASSKTCATGGSSSTSSNSSTTAPGSNSTGKQGSTTPTTGTAAVTSTSGASSASASPASNAASTSDASRTIPAFFALGLSAAAAVFA